MALISVVNTAKIHSLMGWGESLPPLLRRSQPSFIFQSAICGDAAEKLIRVCSISKAIITFLRKIFGQL